MLNKIFRLFNPEYSTLFVDEKIKLKPRYDKTRGTHSKLEQIINYSRTQYSAFLHELETDQGKISALMDDNALNQSSDSALDIASLIYMILYYKPKTLLSIGSGSHIDLMEKTVQTEGLSTKIQVIDKNMSGNTSSSQYQRKSLSDVDLRVFDELEPNDVLYIHNSPRILANSDAMIFYLDILPRLKRGVVVHLNKIYLPYDYPQELCENAYSSQYGLGIHLQAYPAKSDILLPNHFISQDDELKSIISGSLAKYSSYSVPHPNNSFWFRINK